MDVPRPFLARTLPRLLFFVSGATGLSLEVLWIKRFGQLLGSTELALGLVVGTYLAGLGIGARLAAALLPRASRPLAWYGVAELGIGASAVLLPFVLEPLTTWLVPTGDDAGGAALALARFGVAALALGLPTLLLGSTLPALVRHFEAQGESLGAAAGGAYAANSAGAAVGALATGFFLLPAFGYLGTTFAIAAVALTLGLVALGLARGVAAAESRAAGPRAWLGNPVTMALLTGFGALVLQVVWSRQLVLVMGGSTYAWTCLLAVFVGGLGVGGQLFRWLGRTTLAPLFAAIALWTLLGTNLLPVLADWAGDLRTTRASLLGNAWVCLGISAVLMTPATVSMGYALPALFERARERAGSSERAVGQVLFANTLGSVAAALATSAWMIPTWGARGSTLVALGAYGLAAILACRGAARARTIEGVGTLVVCGVVTAWVLLPPQDPRLVRMGAFLYGSAAYADPLLETELVSFEEGPTADVMVLEEPWGEGRVRTLRINGKIDGGDGELDRATQEGLALLPRLLRPEALDLLVIGYGTGTTAGVSLLFPGTSVDCVELEPAVFAAGRHFQELNHRPEASPRYRGIREDGRAYLRRTTKSYDLIVSEPTNPWISGVGNLFTLEFFQEARRRLRPGGALAQWVQLYSLSEEDFGLIVRTVARVFRYVVLLRTGESDALLLGSDLPFQPTREGIAKARELLASEPRLADLYEQNYGTATVEAILLPALVADRAGLVGAASAEGELTFVTDANMRLEFDAPRRLFAEQGVGVRTELDLKVHQRWILGWGIRAGAREGLRRGIDRYRAAGSDAVADRWLAVASQMDPDEPSFHAERLLRFGPPPGTSLGSEVVRLARRDRERALGLVAAWREAGDPRAREASRALLERWPELDERLSGGVRKGD